MAIIDFKHVGVKGFPKENLAARNKTVVPVGIHTPLSLDFANSGFLTMNYNVMDQVDDNLRNLLLTNHGERVVNFDFGANLRPLVAEFSNKEDFDSEAMIRINTAITKWMPYVIPVGFESTPQFRGNSFTGVVLILMVYTVPTIMANETRSLEFTLFVM